MDIEGIKSYLGADWTKVQEIISSALRSDVALLSILNSSIIKNSGKQLRPMVVLLMARACGETTESTCCYAAATEILHNATLIHDDVADESRERRGKPSVSSLIGPSAAVLVGDFWLSKAMAVSMMADYNAAVNKLFSTTLVDLAEGEMLQIEKAASLDTTEEDYLRIIVCKTASLFETAAAVGALSVGASEEMLAAAKAYARNLGIAFQIKDDILDYAGDATLGKPLGSDLLEHKITMPLLGAMVGSTREKEIRAMVAEADKDAAKRDEICRFVLEGGGIDYAGKRLEDYISKSVDALSIFPDSQEKRCLEAIARYNSFRKK